MTPVHSEAAVAIGNFDGVHLGHQALVASALSAAKARGAVPCVLTFSPHPQDVLRPSLQGHRLTTDAEKFTILKNLGMELIWAMPFDKSVAALSAQDFFQKTLVDVLHAKSIHVGEDFHFGNKRSGNTQTLRECGRKAGIEVVVLSDVVSNGLRISSSEIRKKLQEGELAQANALMGRTYRLAGQVQAGDGRGKQLGTPTANINYPKEKVAPRAGVYATRLHWKGKAYASVSNFGVRPTFHTHNIPTLETHILDFHHDLYGDWVEVEFLSRIRDEARFDSVDALRAQMAIDIETARRSC